MLELARDHAVERRQFGQPIGTFQAVRHKLAEAFVAVEAAEAAAAAAWEAYDDFPLAAATAKIVASNSVSIVATHAQQVLAGIGFTEEHPFHLSMKRVVVLDRVLGDATDLVPWVGRALVRRGGAPRLVEL
jgi:alkylation response protein AidB-like acyl-CoA dehydrogenase